MNALFGGLKRAASVAASRAPLASMESSSWTPQLLRTTAASSRSFSSSDEEGSKAFTASLFPGDGALLRSERKRTEETEWREKERRKLRAGHEIRSDVEKRTKP